MEVKGRAVVRCETCGQTVDEGTVKRRSALSIPIVVRASAVRKEQEAVVERAAQSKGISNATSEPAEHASAHAAEDGAGDPCLSQDVVETVGAPESKKIHGIATTDIEEVVLANKIGKFLRVARSTWQRRIDQREVRRDTTTSKSSVEPCDVSG